MAPFWEIALLFPLGVTTSTQKTAGDRLLPVFADLSVLLETQAGMHQIKDLSLRKPEALMLQLGRTIKGRLCAD